MKKNTNKEYKFEESVSSNYAGQEAQGYISASLMSGTTLAENNITILNNVKYRANLRKITMAGTSGNLMAEASCNFTDSGTLTYADKILQPLDLDVNTQICKQDFLDTWEGANMTAGLNGTLPLSFADYIIGQTAERISAEVETSIWSGDATGSNGQFDGFTKLLTADADVIDVASATLSSANIVAQIQLVVDAIPTSVFGKEDVCIFLPTSALKFYINSQATLGYGNVYNMNNEFVYTFNGIPIKHAPGLADDTMVAGRSSNMFFGTDGSRSEVRMLDMAELDGSDNIRLIMRFTAGVNYAFGSDMVLYS